MGTEGNGKSIRQVLQGMIQPDPDRAGTVIAHAAFWLVFQVLAFLLYSAAIPGFFSGTTFNYRYPNTLGGLPQSRSRQPLRLPSARGASIDRCCPA